MHLLITNDDGIYAKGIKALVTHLSKTFQITVVAPDRQQSATSHAITLHKPLHVDRVQLGDETVITAYHVNGTPADCVKLALGTLCAEPPDLVISGINSGANLGLDIIYSGTAAAAAEAVLQGYAAIAVSLTGPPFDFSASVLVTELLINTVLQRGLLADTYLNVNIPPRPYERLAGIAITRTGVRKYRNSYERRLDPLGRSYYWQVGDVLQMHNEPDTDVRAVEEGKVSVTPVHFDFTNGPLLDTLKEWKLTL